MNLPGTISVPWCISVASLEITADKEHRHRGRRYTRLGRNLSWLSIAGTPTKVSRLGQSHACILRANTSECLPSRQMTSDTTLQTTPAPQHCKTISILTQ